MLFFKPAQLGDIGLDDGILKKDKKNCIEFGPCGVGQQALYLNSFFLDRRFYIPASNIQRAYKRVALSKGAYTGKGIFGSIPYLVVEYGQKESIQCTFKHEEHVDMMLAQIRHCFPSIKTMSEAAEQKLMQAMAEEKARYKKDLSPSAQSSVSALCNAREFLEKRPDLTARLAAASKSKRVDQLTTPAQKWIAMAIFLLAMAAALYGAYLWLTGNGDHGLYIALTGIAALFFFSSTRVLPTVRRNSKALSADLEKARSDVDAYISTYPEFPVPARYAHPAVLSRMIRSLREGRSETIPDSYEDMKNVLRTMNSSITVNQMEYDEIIAIKPMFLLENYQ